MLTLRAGLVVKNYSKCYFSPMDNERAFLHSIVSPLAGARLLLDFALEDLQSGAGAEVLASLKEVSKGLERALALIDELEPRMGRLLIRPDLAQREPEGRPDAPNPQSELVRAIPAQREG